MSSVINQHQAFHFFDGVFATIRYDNLRSAVKRVLRGRRRVEQDRFVALRSHYLYESSFTRRGKEGAHEKGGVEGEVGRYRRRHFVPVPKVGSLKELNDLLEDACFAELERRIAGREETVGDTFPAAVQEAGDLGVKFFHVPDGVYRRGTARDNPREAEAVADRIMHWARENVANPGRKRL